MSTFKGKLYEEDFNGCVIDFFLDDVLTGGKAFFLSHFHTDHMHGLKDVKFSQLFDRDPAVKLYCSKITKKMLIRNRMIIVPPERIITLDREPIYISPYDTTIKVTPLRAGHCPGSIMLLFEACDVRALYTGDFRISRKDLTRCKPLHDEDGSILELKSLYLDTTFASSEYENFPPREQSRDNIIKIIRERRNAYKYFVLDLPAKTGIEYLMVELYLAFRTPIHISNSLSMEIVSCIDQLINVPTSDLSKSFIHFCSRWGECHPCPRQDNSIKNNIMEIKPSARYFTKYALKLGDVIFESRAFARVAYSSHSSLRELAEFVSYLKPYNIYPSVINSDQTADEVIQEISLYAAGELGVQLL